MKKEQGFSLIELLIVVAIIAIIAAIAVPSMLSARMAANEAGAIQGCRTIGSAEVAFAAINNQMYATTLAQLTDGQFLDDRFAGGALNGYNYTANTVTGAPTGAAGEVFAFVADPQASKGRYMYGIGADQVVRYMGVDTTDAPAGTVDALCGTTACAAGDPIGKNTASGGGGGS